MPLSEAWVAAGAVLMAASVAQFGGKLVQSETETGVQLIATLPMRG